MAYGPIPNILYSEIFPTRVRGMCIAICALVYWTGDNLSPTPGAFGVYAMICVISLVFVFLKAPETKGMPLELSFYMGIRYLGNSSHMGLEILRQPPPMQNSAPPIQISRRNLNMSGYPLQN
ncbi:monosaccharide-sensing protein 2 [Pyrus ussuriensis x Pyrus communis]|uniref:Monosaccharide-sensing protein 2 n=1 Tax=Pyrus ussuriensis x Pyrus communis TaxID=2448454 RepID=A0A5N5HHB3_9ROSA|nr:monosaccharide-sensing protein 2 [Pyrus ussuriensis x Pyrus communis]